MAPMGEQRRRRHGSTSLTGFIQSTTSGLLSLLTPKPPPQETTTSFPSVSSSTSLTHRATTTSASSCSSTSRVLLPLPLANFVPIPSHHHVSSSPSESARNDSPPSTNSPQSRAITADLSTDSDTGVTPAFRVGRLSSAGKGPAFVGQVFSMCDLTGTGLMAVSTHFDIPFLSKRTPEWMKKMLQTVVKSDNGPMFRFFLDLGDAVTYVKQLNIPSGIVGACRLDLAYEHFKEKPHLFQFVPNAKQVKEANKLLKRIGERKRVDGVPVFSAHNLEIAIATTDGIKWYTPYFFDKNVLDNILEESSDQHFRSLIKTRHLQRRQDVVDDNLPAEIMEDSGDSMLESLEVQELMDEVGYPEIPLSVLSKAAEIQLMHAVDSLLLGNRWLRKAVGIQPRFPYMVDSFEKRSAASLSRSSKESISLNNLEVGDRTQLPDHASELELKEDLQSLHLRQKDFGFPFGNWFSHPWSKQHQGNEENARSTGLRKQSTKENVEQNPLLPKITMVGVSTNEPGSMNRAALKKTMDKLTRELEQDGQGNNTAAGCSSNKLNPEERDPLFVANVGDHYTNMAKTSSARGVRGENN